MPPLPLAGLETPRQLPRDTIPQLSIRLSSEVPQLDRGPARLAGGASVLHAAPAAGGVRAVAEMKIMMVQCAAQGEVIAGEVEVLEAWHVRKHLVQHVGPCVSEPVVVQVQLPQRRPAA
eukprot:3370580-Rhodomonas_salina.1